MGLVALNLPAKSKSFIITLLLVLPCLAAISCSRETGTVPDTPIRIGMIITTSDKLMETSDYWILEVVRNRVSDAGGIEIDGQKYDLKILVREIEGNIPEQAVRAVKQLINQENVVAIVGPHYSSDAIPAGGVAEQSGIPLIAPVSIHPETTADRKYVFRVAFLDDFQADLMARFCLDDLGVKNAAVLYNAANPYSRKLAEVFRDTVVWKGGEIVSFESYVTGETDFTPQLERIRQSSPDVLYLPDYFTQATPIAAKTREMGIEAVLLGVASWDVEKAKNMPRFEGTYIIEYFTLDMLEKKPGTFVEEYASQYGRYPESGTILTYDAICVLLSAIQHAGSSEPDAIRDALYDMGPYEGMTGRIDYVDSGDPEREAVILRLERGRTSPVKKIVTRYEVEPRDLVEK